jgi:cyanophycinase
MTLFAVLLLLTAGPACAGGTLVIVGGGLSPGNAAVHRSFLDARPVGQPGIAIIPSASGAPASSARAITEALVRHGARPEDISVVRLARQDDPATPDVDESRWAANATDPAEIARITRAGAIWLTGGDQLRTTGLLAPGGRETPILSAIRARLAGGAVVGGTSAGAAVMSRAMITEGDPLTGLLQPVSRQAAVEAGAPDNRVAGGGLVMGQGLGFLPQGLVDQHFDTRHRLGRLARALFELPPSDRIGFGIDEDTALVVDLATGTAAVVGAATVTVLDARSARSAPGLRFAAEGVRLSVAAPGDRIALARLEVAPATGSTPRAHDPDEDQQPVQHLSGGMAVPEPPLAALLADSLFGANPLAGLDRPSLRGGKGVLFRFTRLSGAQAWQGAGLPSVTGIAFAIAPIEVLFEGVAP